MINYRKKFEGSKRYQVWESHCGDASEKYDYFFASSDKAASEELERIRKLPSSGYSSFHMERIEQEQVTVSVD